jgi:hypothetical protein
MTTPLEPTPDDAVAASGKDKTTLIDLEKLEVERRKLDLELEKNARQRWWHEDGLVNHRLSWLLVSQALLFAAFGSLSKPTVPGLGPAPEVFNKAMQLIPVVGIAIAVMILAATVAACWAQHKLAVDYKNKIPGFELGVSTMTTLLGWSPSILIPIAFAASWAWLGRFT